MTRPQSQPGKAGPSLAARGGSSLAAVALVGGAVGAAACTRTIHLSDEPEGPTRMDAARALDAPTTDGRGGGGGGVFGGRSPDGRVDTQLPFPSASLPDGGIPGCRDIVYDVQPNHRFPAVLLSIERSTSMLQRFTPTANRLETIQRTLPDVLRTYQGAVGLGYEEFPGRRSHCGAFGPTCCASGVIVHPNLRWNASAITQWLTCAAGSSAFTGCFETLDESPSHEALKKCYEYYKDTDSSRIATSSGFRNILLVTDGEPSCGAVSDACERAHEEVNRARQQGIQVFVVALAEEANRSECLEQIASAGGTKMYVATTEALLRQYFNEILGEVARRACQLQLNSPPANPDRIVVLFNDRIVKRDPTNGWDFVPGSNNLRISFSGQACDLIRMSQVEDIDVRQFCSACSPAGTCR